MGLDFVGVGGFGGYLPFLRFAEALKIPWIIFSDAENTPENIKASVQSQFSKCGSPKEEGECIVFLDEGNDFEKQLIVDGFTDEIRQVIASFDVYSNEQHRAAKEPERLKEISKFSKDGLYEIIARKGKKTQYGPAIAEQIIKSDKPLPSKVIDLFDKIAAVLKIQETEA